MNNVSSIKQHHSSSIWTPWASSPVRQPQPQIFSQQQRTAACMPESSPISEEVTRFTDEQSAALVSSYQENKHLIESASANDTWNYVVADVNAAPCVAKSKSACKRRFKYLKKLYTSAAEINKKSGAARQTSPFDDLFHEMFGGRPSQTLQYVTESGMEKRKHVETPTPDSPPTTVSKNLEDQERHEPKEECQQPKSKKSKCQNQKLDAGAQL